MKLPPGHYCGEVLKRTEVAGLRLLESEYGPNVRLSRHSHASACFSVLLQGTITETYSKGTLDWRPFSFGFNLADEVHTTCVHGRGARFLIIEIAPEWLDRARDLSVVFDSSTVFQGGVLTSLGARLYREVRQPDDISPIAIEGIVLEMMAETSRERAKLFAENRHPRWLERARELIEARFTESLSLAAIADSVGVHPVHLARVFRKHYRHTIGDYQRNLRVQFVCHEITTSDAPFSEIALSAGFYDQGHLSRIFKRHTGMTPAQYRAVSRPR
jgi:AraC family transcriptional regulator